MWCPIENDATLIPGLLIVQADTMYCVPTYHNSSVGAAYMLYMYQPLTVYSERLGAGQVTL